MAISPINISRISQNLRLNLSLDAITRNQRELFQDQVRIASGRSFVTPSDDPESAARARGLRQQLDFQERITQNLQTGSDILAAADTAITDVSDLLIQAQSIASQMVSNLTSPEERRAEAVVIASIRDQLVNVGNRTFNGRYLFAGRDTQSAPFVQVGGGIAYRGDTGNLKTRVADGRLEQISVPGNELFGALSGTVAGRVDLSPRVSEATRLDDLRGATGQGVRRGFLVFSEPDGVGDFTVDLTNADTLGDVVRMINAAAGEAGSSLTASLTDSGLRITPGSGSLLIGGRGGDTIASDLGIRLRDRITGAMDGTSLGARLTMTTPLADLAGGAEIDLNGGLTITRLFDGSSTETAIDLSEAETVQDLIHIINGASIDVVARINEDGTAIDLFNQVSGSSISITEADGTTAADLGLRSMDLSTPLADLNLGRGVQIVAGEPDLRITGGDGTTEVEVNLDGAVTVGDVIDLINAATGESAASIDAELSPTRNGIIIVDRTSGEGTVRVRNGTNSFAADDLGLREGTIDPDDATRLIGRDVNPIHVPGPIDALIRLENALIADDDRALSAAAERLSTIVDDVAEVHGMVGARAAGMAAELNQMQDASLSTRVFLSEVEDLDFAEGISRLQATQTVLQASLMTSSRLLNISLLDFLR